MKKIVPVLVSLFLVLSSAFGAVAVKDLGNGQVELTFTVKNDSVTELGVIGSFDDWTEPGEPMVKNANGEWEYTYTAHSDDELQYKFFNNGSYIFDFKAPDKIDDGFGGNNGLIVVADLLASASSASAGDGDVAEEVELTADDFTSKLHFGMWTIIGPKATFLTQGVVDKSDKGLETDSVAMRGDSYCKISGDLIPNVTTYLEIKVMDGTPAIWSQMPTGDVTNNAQNFLAETLARPASYYGWDPSFCKTSFGIEAPYVVWETGMNYFQTGTITTGLWETLTSKDSGQGYMRFNLGESLQNIGPAKVTATIMANKLLSSYGLLAVSSVVLNNYTFGIQYDMKSKEADDFTKMFEVSPPQQDILLSAKGVFGAFTAEVNALTNVFDDNTETTFGNRSAVEAKVSYSADMFGGYIGGRYTGKASSMLYGDNDNLVKDQIKPYLNAWVMPIDMLTVGADANYAFYLENKAVGYSVYEKPYVKVVLDDLIGKKAEANAYGKMYQFTGNGYSVIDDNDVSNAMPKGFNLYECGLNFYIEDLGDIVQSAELVYGLDNQDEFKMFNTVFAKVGLPHDVDVQLGFGYRSVKDIEDNAAEEVLQDQNNPIAFSVGGSWKVPVRAIKTPLLYGAFVYNMDPYGDDTEGSSLDMADYVTDDGVNNFDGKAQLRLLLKWNF